MFLTITYMLIGVYGLATILMLPLLVYATPKSVPPK